MIRIGDVVLTAWPWVPLALACLAALLARAGWRSGRTLPFALGALLTPLLLAATYVGLPIVLNNAQLGLLSSYQYFAVLRLGVNAVGDAPAQWFVPSSSACTISGGDVGSQVPSADGGCFNAAFAAGPVDVREWGAPPDDGTHPDAGAAIDRACLGYYAILIPATPNGFYVQTPVVCTGVAIVGVLSSPINPYPSAGFPGQSWLNCGTGASTVCLTVGSTAGSITSPINVSNLMVSQATTPPPSGFTGLEVLNSYRTRVSNVHVYNADTCLLAKGNGLTGVDLTFDDVGVDRCQTHWWVIDQINGVHIVGGDDGTDAFSGPSAGPEYASSVDVYEFTNTLGGTSYQGPNTIYMFDHRYINSAGGAACLFNWTNFNPTTPDFSTVGGGIKLIGNHFEQHAFVGTARGTLCSDSSAPLINNISIQDNTFTMGSTAFGFFALNSATALKSWFVDGNLIGGCGNVTLAPIPASGPALMDVNFANNVGCVSASFTSNSVGSNYLYSSANDWASLTIGGAWARLSSLSDVYGSLTDTASGNVDWINAFPLTWTPVLECGGTPCSSLGWTVTPSNTIVRRDGSGFYASALMTVSVKGTASGAALTVVGLPWECLQSYGQPSPLMGLTNPTTSNIVAAQAQIGGPVSGATPVYLYKMTSTGITGIVDNDFTSTTAFSFNVYCSRTQ